MSANAPRSIDEYLEQLRSALEGEDPALVQDALYDAEEYLRAEVAAHPEKSEAELLELIARTYGTPEEVAAAYRDTEAKVKAALKAPVPPPASGATSVFSRFFRVYLDPRAYTSLFYLLLTLATGIVYFTFVAAGISLSFFSSFLIVGVPLFLAFIGVARVIALGEGRLLEAMTGERMPRRPLHPGAPASVWTRIGEMLKDVRTWTTLLYLIIMLPLGVIYFSIAVVGLFTGLRFALAPLGFLERHFGWFAGLSLGQIRFHEHDLASPHTLIGALFLMILGIVILTWLMHAARSIARAHARLAKALLVEPGG